jgi:hypothetical protein
VSLSYTLPTGDEEITVGRVKKRCEIHLKEHA